MSLSCGALFRDSGLCMHTHVIVLCKVTKIVKQCILLQLYKGITASGLGFIPVQY